MRADMEKSSDQISTELVEKEKQIIEAMKVLDVVQEEKHLIDRQVVLKRDTMLDLKKEISGLEQKADDLSESVRKGKHNLSTMRSEKQILERQYWKARG